jgi:hypothetical protein
MNAEKIAKLKAAAMNADWSDAARMKYLAERNAAQYTGMRIEYSPALTPEQRRAHDEYVKLNNLPF